MCFESRAASPKPSRCTMNIFRLCGDLSHLLAILLLLVKIWKTRSCAGNYFVDCPLALADAFAFLVNGRRVGRACPRRPRRPDLRRYPSSSSPSTDINDTPVVWDPRDDVIESSTSSSIVFWQTAVLLVFMAYYPCKFEPSVINLYFFFCF